MSSPPSLVVLAAGMSRRYGTPKQFAPLGPSGEALMDYAVYDALGAGAARVLLVLNETHVPLAAERFANLGNRISWIVQDPRPVPGRTKPWGTGHAILSAARTVRGPFVTVNADDFYGRDAITTAFDAVRHEPDHHALIGFPAGRTLSPAGGVSRGRIEARDGCVRRIAEIHDLRRGPEGLVGQSVDGESVSIDEDTPVSMNLWALAPSICTVLEDAFTEWRAENGSDPDREFLIGEVITRFIARNAGVVHLLAADGDWFGLTFPSDRDAVKRRLHRLAEVGAYPSPLFGD